MLNRYLNAPTYTHAYPTMSLDLIDQILDHPNPERLLGDVRSALTREREARQQFRAWLKPDVKAEFINGEIVSHSPARRRHNQTVKHLSVLLELFAADRKLGEVAIEKAMVELDRNDFEPDICFWRAETAASFTDDMLYYPAPDLVVEVLSKSTEDRDRGIKFRSYEEAGVAEYWIVDPVRQRVEQFVRGRDRDDRSALLRHAELGVNERLASRVLTGFDVEVRAFFDGGARGEALRSLTGE